MDHFGVFVGWISNKYLGIIWVWINVVIHVLVRNVYLKIRAVFFMFLESHPATAAKQK